MSKKLPFSRSLCPFRAALEREQNSVDSKISAGAPGLRGTGKRCGKGARFPSAWREQALVSGVSMGREKQIRALSRPITLFWKAHTGDNAPLAAGQGEKGLGGHGEGRRGPRGREPAAALLLHPIPPPRSALRGAGGGSSASNSPRRLFGWERWGHPRVFLSIFCVVL